MCPGTSSVLVCLFRARGLTNFLDTGVSEIIVRLKGAVQVARQGGSILTRTEGRTRRRQTIGLMNSGAWGAALITATLFTGAAGPAFAQTIERTPPPPPPLDAPATAPDPEADNVEEIVVTGIRGALTNALENRRRSDVIIDGISADDIGSTPDLNLGEALQRIPGVQINRSDDRRDASISVRGLPSEYTRTSVMGQSIATPDAWDPWIRQSVRNLRRGDLRRRGRNQILFG